MDKNFWPICSKGRALSDTPSKSTRDNVEIYVYFGPEGAVLARYATANESTNIKAEWWNVCVLAYAETGPLPHHWPKTANQELTAQVAQWYRASVS